MRRLLATTTIAAALVAGVAAPSIADSAKPGQSMTHLKTAPGIAATLTGAGVQLYGQGGATSGVMGASVAAADGQVVFHIPVTGTRGGVQHAGSTLVLFRAANGQQVQLLNPVIDLARGVVIATVPQGTGQPVPVLSITNASSLKPKSTTKAGIRTTTYTGAQLAIAPGIGNVLSTLLGLPAGSLPDGTVLATAEVTLNAKAKR